MNYNIRSSAVALFVIALGLLIFAPKVLAAIAVFISAVPLIALILLVVALLYDAFGTTSKQQVVSE